MNRVYLCILLLFNCMSCSHKKPEEDVMDSQFANHERYEHRRKIPERIEMQSNVRDHRKLMRTK